MERGYESRKQQIATGKRVRMLENYIQLLTESLEQKKEALQKVIPLNEEQNKIACKEPFDLEAFDAIVEEKSLLIEQMTHLDNGFEQVYQRNHAQLEKNKIHYKKEIAYMKELIAQILELGITIQASEERNKKQMEVSLKGERSKMRQRKVGNKAAMDYYKSMSQVNYIDPQLLDQKK